jgi:hypothetical protein
VRSAGKLGYYWQLFAGLGWTSIHWLHKINQPTWYWRAMTIR